jgi:hypothetical protein
MDPQEKKLFDCLPYGQWHTKGNAVVLFDREHRPIYSKKGGDITPMNGDEWIEDIIPEKTEYFYKDGTTPQGDFHTLAKVKKVLADWTMNYRLQKVSQLALPNPKSANPKSANPKSESKKK